MSHVAHINTDVFFNPITEEKEEERTNTILKKNKIKNLNYVV